MKEPKPRQTPAPDPRDPEVIYLARELAAERELVKALEGANNVQIGRLQKELDDLRAALLGRDRRLAEARAENNDLRGIIRATELELAHARGRLAERDPPEPVPAPQLPPGPFPLHSTPLPGRLQRDWTVRATDRGSTNDASIQRGAWLR